MVFFFVQAKTIAALGKVADFVGEDTPPDIVASLTSNVFSATLTATDGISGEGVCYLISVKPRLQVRFSTCSGNATLPKMSYSDKS